MTEKRYKWRRDDYRENTKGLLMLNTGDGKGKTSAAFGVSATLAASAVSAVPVLPHTTPMGAPSLRQGLTPSSFGRSAQQPPPSEALPVKSPRRGLFAAGAGLLVKIRKQRSQPAHQERKLQDRFNLEQMAESLMRLEELALRRA